MSDHNERACTNCGSLTHHEDDCQRGLSVAVMPEEVTMQGVAAVAVGSACLVPEITEGQWLTIRGHRFRVNQICGESVYLRLERCNWDTPVPMAEVIRALSSPND